MDGQLRCGTALSEEFKVAGKLYRAYTPTIAQILDIKKKARVAMQVDALAVACRVASTLPPEEAEAVRQMGFKQAVENRAVTEDYFQEWGQTIEGLSALLQVMVRHADGTPVATDDEAIALLQEARDGGVFEEVLLKMQLARGDADLGNSSGRSQRGPAQNQWTGTQSSADGHPSTSSSPASTDGPPAK